MQNIIRKNICKFLQKYLRNNLAKYHPKTYLFVRWIISLIEDEDEANDVVRYIALWMAHNDKVNNPFTDIFLVGDIIYIVTDRPGLWIGKYGKNMDDLIEYIRKMTWHKYTINLIETNVSNRVTAVKYVIHAASLMNE